MDALQQRSLQVAKRFVGQREATGRNDGRLPRLVQRWVAAGARWLDGQPWCACFATYCVHTAARELGVKVRMPASASSSALYRWFVANGARMTVPVAGCVGLIRGGRTGHEHTFLVHAVNLRAGSVVGVDGNWKNAVSWTHHRIEDCDFGVIC